MFIRTGIVLLAIQSCLTAQAPKNEPEELVLLRARRQEAAAQALRPLDLKYEQALLAMKTRLIQAGNLDGALAVNAELKALANQVGDLGGDRRKEVKELTPTDLEGKWTTVGNTVEIRKGEVLKNGEVVGSVRITSASGRGIALTVGQYVDTLQVSAGGDMMAGLNSVGDRVWWKRSK